MHIGQRIKNVREKRGRTLLEVANHLGVSEPTVQRYESGNIKNLKLDTISKIAEFLNVDPAYLMGWDKDKEKKIQLTNDYTYIPTSISAGTPIVAEPVADYETEKITLPDNVMGKWAGHEDIFIMRINGESMNKVMPHGSLIAVKEVELPQLKDGDMVVYSDNHEYAVKRFYMYDDELIFRPDSEDLRFSEMRIPKKEADNIKIHGKVVLYIVELD